MTQINAAPLYDAFTAEGSTGAFTGVVADLHGGEYHMDVLSEYDVVVKDDTTQRLKDNASYKRLVAAGVPVASLGRTMEGHPDLQPAYSDQEIEQAAQHLSQAGVALLLQEYPLRLLNAAGTETPAIACLYRSRPDAENVAVQGLCEAVRSGKVVACTTDSVSSKDAYAAVGVPESNIHVIHNGIDTGRFRKSAESRAEVRQALDIPEESPVVVFVSRYSAQPDARYGDEKNVPLFVESAREYLEGGDDRHIIMAGAGLDRGNPNLKALVERVFDGDEALMTRLHAMGMRPDVEKMYTAADVAALTSRTESYPLCLLEALASGITAVSTNAGDSAKILEGHGLIVPGDPNFVNPADMAAKWDEAYQRRAELIVPAEERPRYDKREMIRSYGNLIAAVA